VRRRNNGWAAMVKASSNAQLSWLTEFCEPPTWQRSTIDRIADGAKCPIKFESHYLQDLKARSQSNSTAGVAAADRIPMVVGFCCVLSNLTAWGIQSHRGIRVCCIGFTVVVCMCMEWTTGPNAKTYRAFSRRPGFAATKQPTRPWWSM
jgi:hypothetical protein